MTENRYYYTDPLAAAWMAYRFGVRFISWWYANGGPECTQRSYEELASWVKAWPEMSETERGCVRFEIDPDSLYLLEPQAGDVLEGLAGFNWLTEQKMGENLAYVRDSIAKGNNKIIQRNGVAFHWPEGGPA